jgi:hypothetical protein
VSRFPDDGALAMDGLMFDWANKDIYAFPPTTLIPLVIKKLQREHGLVTLVAPLLWTRSWTTGLVNRRLVPPLGLPLHRGSASATWLRGTEAGSGSPQSTRLPGVCTAGPAGLQIF